MTQLFTKYAHKKCIICDDSFEHVVHVQLYVNMKFLLIYFVIVLICQTLSGHNGKKASNDKCPLSCQCNMSPLNNITRWKVTCDQKYWKKVPPLPYNTIELSMLSMPTLGSGSFTKTEGKTLRKLMLTDNKKPVTFEPGSLRYICLHTIIS